MKHPKNYWKNRENMMREARKYSTKDEFKKNNLSAFLAAHRYGYIDDMDWLVIQKQHKKGYWTYKHIEERLSIIRRVNSSMGIRQHIGLH